MATIEKRGDGQYRARVRKRGYPEVGMTFMRRSDAAAWARKIESEQERGLWRDCSEAESTTLGKALTRYKIEVTAKKRGADKEEYLIDLLGKDPIADKSLARVRTADIADLRDRWLATLSPATVARRFVVLSHVFTVARREWGMESLANPVELVRLPSPEGRRQRRVTDTEIKAICTSSGSAALPAVVILAVETGMRRGEIVGLRWADIDLSRRVVHLAQTKNGSPRDVPLSPAAVAALQALPRNISGCVFDQEPNSLTLAFTRACARAGLSDIRLHDLRHEATSRLFERGLGIMEVAAITGHKTLGMLQRYTHLRAEDLAKKLG